QNPFYCALPYNDKASTGHRSEASQVVPWFKEAYQGPAVSTCKGRWVAIRKGDHVAYAQWEDAGPFRTDHWQYVFGNERPKPNLNKGAGLDVSPAVRDFLGLGDTDVTDWRFVDFEEVPHGPWAQYGDNNTFVINQRQGGSQTVGSHSSADLIRYKISPGHIGVLCCPQWLQCASGTQACDLCAQRGFSPLFFPSRLQRSKTRAQTRESVFRPGCTLHGVNSARRLDAVSSTWPIESLPRL